MVEPLNTKAWQSALDALGTVKANQLEPDLRIAVSAYISALPSLPVVDGGELVERLAYRVGNPSAWPEGFDQKASDLFRSAASLISSQKQEIDSLNHGGNILQANLDLAESRVLSLEEEVKRLREALKPFVNVRDQHPESVKLINGSLDGFTVIEVKVTKDQFLAAHAALKENGNG